MCYMDGTTENHSCLSLIWGIYDCSKKYEYEHLRCHWNPYFYMFGKSAGMCVWVCVCGIFLYTEWLIVTTLIMFRSPQFQCYFTQKIKINKTKSKPGNTIQFPGNFSLIGTEHKNKNAFQ